MTLDGFATALLAYAFGIAISCGLGWTPIRFAAPAVLAFLTLAAALHLIAVCTGGTHR